MSREEVLSIVNEIFIDVFDDEDIVINDNTTANDIEDWDSLEQVNLIVAIEKKFVMKFKMEEVYSMKNVGEMIDIILERTALQKRFLGEEQAKYDRFSGRFYRKINI